MNHLLSFSIFNMLNPNPKCTKNVCRATAVDLTNKPMCFVVFCKENSVLNIYGFLLSGSKQLQSFFRGSDFKKLYHKMSCKQNFFSENIPVFCLQ